MARRGPARRGACLAAVIAALLALPVLILVTQPVAAASGPRYDHQANWALDDLSAPQLWAAGQGANAKVAIIGTGARPGDPDLAGATITQVSLVHGAGSGDAEGTRVAEVIAGQGGHGDPDGTVGLAPRAHVTDILVAATPAGITAGAIAAGITAAVAAKARVIDVPAGVSQQGASLKKAVATAIASGCLIVSGIIQGGGSALYPADSDGVLAVAGVDRSLRPDGSLAKHGPRAVYAPDAAGSGPPGNDVAAGYVAAAATLIWSADPRLSLKDLQEDLYTDVTMPPGAHDGFGVVAPRSVLSRLGIISPALPPSSSPSLSSSPHSSGPLAGQSTAVLPPPGPQPTLGALVWAFVAVAGLALLAALAALARPWRRRSGHPGSPGQWQSDIWE
ncbi:MAG TPA: S8 family serine peptidase [Trebonia sp.]|jgi:hypothetical protein|nr:S8 family serine peptidase [Trebonia sp.]